MVTNLFFTPAARNSSLGRPGYVALSTGLQVECYEKGQLGREQSLGLLPTAHQRVVAQLLCPAVPLRLGATDVHLKVHRQGAVIMGPSKRKKLPVFTFAAVASRAGASVPGC